MRGGGKQGDEMRGRVNVFGAYVLLLFVVVTVTIGLDSWKSY